MLGRIICENIISHELTRCLSVFLTLNSECQIHFLKFLIQTGQVESWRRMIKAFPNELTSYITIFVGSKTDGPDDLLEILLPRHFRNSIHIRTYQNCTTADILAIKARPVTILNLTNLKTSNPQTAGYGYMYWIDDMFEMLFHCDPPTAVVVNESASRTLQYFLRNICHRWKCPFLVIGQSSREKGLALRSTSTYVLDHSNMMRLPYRQNMTHIDQVEQDQQNNSCLRNIFETISYFLSPSPPKMENCKEIEIVDYPSMPVHLALSNQNTYVSLQLKEDCHLLKTHNVGERCINPTIKLKANYLLDMEVFYSGCRFPRIECVDLRGNDVWCTARILSITNTDFSMNHPTIKCCTHAPAVTPLPLMRFTARYSIFHYTGVSDIALKLTAWSSAKRLWWKRSYNPAGGAHQLAFQDILNCPSLLYISIHCLLTANDPITVRFRSPKLFSLEVYCLEGSDAEYLDLRNLLDHQHESDNPKLSSVTLQLSTDEDVDLPLWKLEPFRKTLLEVLIKGFSTPWIWSYGSNSTIFPNLLRLRIDISHIPMRPSPHGGSHAVNLDFGEQFPCLESLDIRARMMHYLRFIGPDDEGIDLVLNTRLPMKWLYMTPSIKTRSITLNNEMLYQWLGGFPLKPFYVRSWNLKDDRVEYCRVSERRYYGDYLRYW